MRRKRKKQKERAGKERRIRTPDALERLADSAVGSEGWPQRLVLGLRSVLGADLLLVQPGAL